MRIISVRLEPVARVLCLIYAVFGLGAFLLFEFSDTQYLTLPLGIVAPLFHLNVNFNLPRSTSFVLTVLCGIAEILAYAATGWITGAAAAWCFNVVAKLMGGIDAKYVSIVDELAPASGKEEPRH